MGEILENLIKFLSNLNFPKSCVAVKGLRTVCDEALCLLMPKLKTENAKISDAVAIFQFTSKQLNDINNLPEKLSDNLISKVSFI